MTPGLLDSQKRRVKEIVSRAPDQRTVEDMEYLDDLGLRTLGDIEEAMGDYLRGAP
jgi:hypothetical protein